MRIRAIQRPVTCLPLQWCQANNYKKIAFFYTPSDTSQTASKKLIEEKLPAEGIELVGVVEVETGTLDCGPAAVQALGFGAEGYFCCLRADEAGKVINELRGRGVENGLKFVALLPRMAPPFWISAVKTPRASTSGRS